MQKDIVCVVFEEGFFLLFTVIVNNDCQQFKTVNKLSFGRFSVFWENFCNFTFSKKGSIEL